MLLDGQFKFGTNITVGNADVGIFTVADQAGAGGETCYGFETMDCIYTYDLQWFKQGSAGNFWRTWAGHYDPGDNPPYRNYTLPNLDPLNSFFTTDDQFTCPLPLP